MPGWQQGVEATRQASRLRIVSVAPRAELKRRRRSRDEAEHEILEAAAALLRERPLQEVTVSAIMDQTTLSRKSFYVYFRDRYDLLTRLFRPLRRELDEVNALFLTRPAGDVSSPAVFEAVTSFMAGPSGTLVRALHEASS